MVETTERPRVRVPAGSGPGGSIRGGLLAGLSTIAFRGIGAAASREQRALQATKKPAAEEDEEMAAAEADEEAAATEPKDPPEDTEDDKPAKPAKAKTAKGKRKTDDDSKDEDEGGEGEEGDNDDDDDREDMRAGTPSRAMRLRERARVAAILESSAAAANLEFAVRLALTTDLPRLEAIALLEAAPKAAGGRLADRMAQYGNLRPGAGAAAAPKGQAAIDALWDAQAMANGFRPARSR
ncbi:hypothetical protein [Rhodopila sp.]|uniref:hypothetical protein n=1 Tax=Rhodopila sp. TaxID=2480087 RepID=UPI003D099374